MTQQTASDPATRVRHPAIVLVASADGLVAIRSVLSPLPEDFPAPIVLVLHRSAQAPTLLADLLAKATRLKVKRAEAGDTLQAGCVYVAPPDAHLLVRADKTLALSNGRRIKHVHSSANPLFESAARAFGDDLIAVVLTGSGSDGTDGVQTVKAEGGVVIAQDPKTCRFASMPRSAIGTGAVDHVLALDEIPSLLVRLVQTEKP